MSEHRYARKATAAGYARALTGLVVTGAPLVLGEPGLVFALVLAAVFLLFLVYGVRTGIRGATRIRLDDQGVAALGPLPLAVSWRDLSRVELRYFATKRESKDGWMQLNLTGAGRTLRIESTLQGFPDIVRRAVDEAETRGVALSATTLNNLRPLGIRSEAQ